MADKLDHLQIKCDFRVNTFCFEDNTDRAFALYPYLVSKKSFILKVEVRVDQMTFDFQVKLNR